MKIEARPWKPKDIIDDLQSIIDEESDSYLNTRRSTDPLTLEELREMDGEPVWVETTDIKKANRWAFVDVGSEVVRFFDTRCGVKCPVMGNLFRTYGKTWFAYRRKPEEDDLSRSPRELGEGLESDE